MFSCDNSTEPELESYDCNDYIDEICGSCSVLLWGECHNISQTTLLHLGGNQLTGEIPPEIGYLTNLTHLWLNGNQLTGEIPPEIGNLTNLTRLYLYDNQLTGEIPQEVCDLIESNNLDIILYGNDDLIYTCD